MSVSFSILRLLFPLLLIGSLKAQEPAMWPYTDEDGLPSMTIYRILQDSKGYIWFGTANGICRFDGYRFKTFSSPLLGNNEILFLSEDDRQRLIFINMKGQLLQVKDEQIAPLFQKTHLLKNISTKKIAIQGKDLFLVDDGLMFYRGRLDEAGELLDLKAVDAFEAVQDVVLLGQSAFIVGKTATRKSSLYECRLDDEEGTFHFQRSINRQVGESIFQLDLHRQSVLVFNSHRYLLQEGQWRSYENAAYLHTMYGAGDQLLQMTSEGIFVSSCTDGHAQIVEHWLPGVDVYCSFKDREGGFWIGTASAGLYYIPNPLIKVWTEKNGKLADDDVFYIGQFNQQSPLIIGMGSAQICFMEQEQISKPIKITAQGRVMDIILQTPRRMVLGMDNGLYALDLNQSIRPIAHHYGAVKGLHLREDDQLYISLHNSLKTTSYQQLFHPAFDKGEVIIQQRTTAVTEGQSNDIWIGTIRGLYRYQSGILDTFPTPASGMPYYVNDLCSHSNGDIWVATENQGLVGIRDGKLQYHLHEANGLVGNSCDALYNEGDSILWVGTSKGLNKIRYADWKIWKIDKADGLPSNEIRSIFTAGKYCWLGTPEGLVQFDKSKDFTNASKPNLYFTKVKVKERDTVLATHYTLPHNENNLYVEYTGLGYRSKGRLHYQYRLLGLDSNWVDTETQFVRYPSLNPGAYELQLKVANEDGVWSEASSLHFNVLFPWWEAIWVRVLFVLSSIALIGLFFYSRFRYLQKKERERQAIQERINGLKMQALQTQMNPHFIFNSLNAIQKYLTTSDEEQAMIYLARFARLIRTIFELSKKHRISLEEELSFLRLYLDMEKLRFGEKVNINLLLDPEVQQQVDDILIPPLLLQPVIENAFKHGLFHKQGDGKLKISFRYSSNQHLICEVEDDGVGRANARLFAKWKPGNYQSSGLQTTRERLGILNNSTNLDEHQSELQIIDLLSDSGRPRGTRVIIQIKCKTVS
ncbi:MAG: histidine kinase [Bacteroidota bacterium]